MYTYQLDPVKGARSNPNIVPIPSEDSYDFIPVSSIIRCEGWQKYTKVHLTESRVVVSSYNIGVYMELLAPYSFFLTHKSHLINDRHLSRYLKEGVIVLSDGSTVPVSRRRKEEFLDIYVRREKSAPKAPIRIIPSGTLTDRLPTVA